MTSPPYTSGADDADALSAYRDPHRGYAAYLDDLRAVFEQVRGLVLPAGWVVVEAANLKDEAGVTSLAWDVCRALERVLRFRGEVVVGWEPTYGYGYDHSYCLVFTV
jgi:hypothetical protein